MIQQGVMCNKPLNHFRLVLKLATEMASIRLYEVSTTKWLNCQCNLKKKTSCLYGTRYISIPNLMLRSKIYSYDKSR